jgi:hypothetical protein
MKMRLFYHLYLVNNWFEIMAEHIDILKRSGLYDACEKISIGVIGNTGEQQILEGLLRFNPKMGVSVVSENPMDYEFLTLRLIENDPSEYIGFYFHVKGVTYPCDPIHFKERNFLNEIMINQWRTHVRLIEAGYDISSVNYLTIPNRFSGNYFWFNRSRINNLPRLDTLDLTDRFQAEKWIYSGK